ncbi:hypothetical protein TBLA_0H01020 [Henningerozyma blattae CBS 6284]|uniref:HMG box domain-containing protein n=1 Tax=Henningerozyma blattae (strain ATCC 34711 / CBS 6284 / DSM 70876 / NBRC 10599 / NRRL Y-10934 / UCD 77-7) TaxID=1071380 RepID=I2H7N8_HENB6|nr:hypothetical protein TBLA_0H01020 [Tetrapisispora blattae CBS 6284]CCH62390.1 hypothetical protein TBLA_0H01020 [Tetrapisispora blattae CBS 6284]
MNTDSASVKLRTAKDSLVSSLFELSKSANQTASNIIDFYNTIDQEEGEKIEAINTLTDSLFRLTDATNHLHLISSDLTNPMDLDIDTNRSLLSTPPSTADKTANGKKARVEKDPNAPKKPLTVFFAYSAYIRSKIREERALEGLPPLSPTEITQEISKKWKGLDEKEKSKWKDAYHIELQNYLAEKNKYLEDKKNGTLPLDYSPSAHARVPNPFTSIIMGTDTSSHSSKKDQEHDDGNVGKEKEEKEI